MGITACGRHGHFHIHFGVLSTEGGIHKDGEVGGMSSGAHLLFGCG